jgi:fibro-slime domain-containing protein
MRWRRGTICWESEVLVPNPSGGASDCSRTKTSPCAGLEPVLRHTFTLARAHLQRRATYRFILSTLSVGLLAACGGGPANSTFESTSSGSTGAGGASQAGSTSTGTTTGAAGNGIVITVPDGGFGTGGTGSSDGGMIVGVLPPDFTPAESGGYKLGNPIMGAGLSDTGANGGCNEIVGVVRDFKGFNVAGGQPDFEHFNGGGTKGLVEVTLGADSKPVYTGACEAAQPPHATCPDGQMTTGKANYDQWYRFTDGVNKPYLVYFFFQPTPGGSVITFDSQNFFPVDGAGWQAPGVTGGDMAQNGHNFAFTTELHTKFKYLGGETFTFEGDDDLWVFMNHQLAIDLGGLHPALKGTVNLDMAAAALGITQGNTYPLDLFHAERHTTASHFRVQTTLSLVDCGTIPPDVPK